MHKIDNYILDFFQKTYDILHYWTGKNCFFFSRICVIPGIAALMAGNFVDKVYLIACINFVLGIMLYFLYLKEERDYKPDMANICKVKYLTARTVTLALIIFNIITLYRLYALGNALLACAGYFLACEINPKAKIFEWKKSLTFTLKPIKVPSL